MREIFVWMVEKLKHFGYFLGQRVILLGRYLKLWLFQIPRLWWQRILIGLPVLFVVYLAIGMMVVTRIDDSYNLFSDKILPAKDFGSNKEPGSKAAEIVIALLDRETLTHNWTVNDPPFLPGWWVDNTPSYQRGMMGAMSRFVIEMRDHLGRTRGSSAVDPDLEAAAGNLTREMDRWIFDLSTSVFFTAPSDSYFREASRQLQNYNSRLKNGQTVFDRRADNLMATLDRIALDLGASSAATEKYIRDYAGDIGFDTGNDNLFYQTKGQLYAYSYILTGLEQDFSKVIADKELESLFRDLTQSLILAAQIRPAIVLNGSADGVFANHLGMQGFYLLRARTQLREVTNILLT